MMATPLGLLAGSAAWGEWGPDDYSDPEKRPEIQAASGGVAPPAEAPEGMQSLAGLWKAPFTEYEPPFLKREHLGYVLAAVFGVGFILLVFLLIEWLWPFRARPSEPIPPSSPT
jgi:cobalt/nickel transport system permease protein